MVGPIVIVAAAHGSMISTVNVVVPITGNIPPVEIVTSSVT